MKATIRCLGRNEFGAIEHRIYFADGRIYIVRSNEEWCDIFRTRIGIRKELRSKAIH